MCLAHAGPGVLPPVGAGAAVVGVATMVDVERVVVRQRRVSVLVRRSSRPPVPPHCAAAVVCLLFW